MSEVKIIITAETAQAAQALQQFAQQAGSGLKGIVPAVDAANTGLGQLRQGNILLRSGMMELNTVMSLTAGTRLPQLGMGVMALRSTLLMVRASAQLLKLSVGEILIPLAAVGAVVGAAAYVWRSFSSAQEEAARKNKEFADSLKEIPVVLERIQMLTKSGLLSPAAAAELADYLSGRKKLYRTAAGEVTPQAESLGLGMINTGVTMPSTFGAMPLKYTGTVRTPNVELELKEVIEYVQSQSAFMYTAQAQARASLTEFGLKAQRQKLEGIEKEKAEVIARFDAESEKIDLLLKQEGPLATAGEVKKANQARLDLASALQKELADIDKKAAEDAVKCDREALAMIEADQKAQFEAEKLRHQEAMAQFEIDRARIQNVIEALRGNPFLSEQEKAAQSAAFMQKLMQANESHIGALQSTAAQTTDAAAALEAQKQITQLMREQAALQNELLKDQATGTFWGTYRMNLAQLKTQWADVSASLATGSFQIMQQGINGLSGALTSIIMGTQSAAQAFAQFGVSLLTSFISMIIEAMLWAWIAIPVLTALGVLSGGAIPAAGAPATVGAVGSAVAGVSAIAVAGGGLIRGPGTATSDSIPAMLSDGEFVVSAAAVGRIGAGALNAINAGRITGRGSADSPARPFVLNQHFYDKRPHPRDYLNTAEGQHQLVELSRKLRLQIGIPT